MERQIREEEQYVCPAKEQYVCPAKVESNLYENVCKACTYL